MKEAILSSDPANTTRLTVVLVLIVVVEEIADEARILPEPGAALLAVHLDLLASVAFGANQLHELLSVECVRLGVIVTEAARINLPATRALVGDERFFWKQ